MNRSLALGGLFAVCLASTAFAQAGGKIEWSYGPVADVVAQAVKDRKPTMVYFHADW